EQNGNTEWVEFEGNNSGIAIGGNNTDQVIVVSGKDNEMKDISGNAIYSGSEMALVHEIIHAARGVSGLKSVNEDEEAHAIKLENIIRNELGYGLRGDGDASDDVNSDDIPDGDESYGRYTNQDKGDIQSPVYSHYEGTSVESGEEYLTVLAEQYGAICKWFEPNGAFPNGRALVSLNGISKIYTPDECKVVNNKIVVNANEFRFAFDIGLNAGEAYLKKLLDEYEYLPWNLEHDEKNKTYTLSLLDSGIPPKVYKVGENGVRIENDRLVVNTDEFYYHFELRLDPTETYLEKFAKESGGKYTFDESSQTATVTVTTTKGTITKEYHVSESSYLYTDSGIALYYYSPVWMDPSGNIVVDKQLLYKDFYGHLNILSSTIGDVISFYYENGKLAYVGDSLPAENASDNYIKCTNSLISEYISEILGMSSDKCYIENDWDNFSVLDMKNYSWNGKKYMSTEYSLNLSINGEKFKIKPHFVFNANRDVYVEKASILSALKETLEEGKYGSYDSLPTYKSNNGYTNIMNYLKKNTIIPQESIEYSNGLFKIKGQELNINTINIKDSASQEGDIYSYAKAYELYTELKKIAPEYLITHWVESYGEHEEGLGHKKVLIEKYNEGCNIEHDISLNWHDTGEYTGFISGCPDCNSKAVKVEEYINSKYNIPEIVQKKGINDNVGLFTGGYYPFYYLDKELVFPGMFGKKTYEYESLYLIEGVDLYADPSAIDSVIQKETGVLPVLGDLNLSVARNSLYESETLTILATCPNAHHIFVRIVDENGNTVYQKRTAGNSASINTILDTAGVYKIYAAARNASEDVINSTFTETLNPVIITVKKLPQLEVVNVLDNEIEVRATFPVDGDSSNTLLVKNTSGQSWTEIGSGIKNGTTQLIKGLTSGTNYTICMRWIEDGVQMEKTVEVETPVTKSSGRYGDLNADGKINSTDYAILKRYILGTIDKFPVTDGSYVADLNADGRINSTDYTLLKRYLLSPDSTVLTAEKFLSETPYVNLTNLKNNEIYVAVTRDDGSKVLNIKGEGTNCHHIGLFVGSSKGKETLKNLQNNSGLKDTVYKYDYDYPVSQSGVYSIFLAGRNAHDTIKGSTLDKSETVTLDVIVPGSKSSTLEQAQLYLLSLKKNCPALASVIDLGPKGADGLWGQYTSNSIREFQKWCAEEWLKNNSGSKDSAYLYGHLYKVSETGLLDRNTLNALKIEAEKYESIEKETNLPANGANVEVIIGDRSSLSTMLSGVAYTNFEDFALKIGAIPGPLDTSGNIRWTFPSGAVVDYNSRRINAYGEYANGLIQVTYTNGTKENLYYYPAKNGSNYSAMVDVLKMAEISGYGKDTYVRKDENGNSYIIVGVPVFEADKSTLGSMAWNFVQGLWEALKDAVRDLWNMITNPGQLIEGIKFLGKALVPGSDEQKLLFKSIWDMLNKSISDFYGGTNDDRARTIGKLVGTILIAILGDKGCKVALNMLKESAKVGKLAQLAAKLGKGESLIDDVARGVMAAAEFVTKLKTLLKEGIERIFERIRSVFRNSDDLILVDNITGQEFILSRSQLKSELIESGMTDDAAEMALKCLEDGCFAGNTMVLTKSGSKRIDEIQEGEYILSKDINTGEESYKKVKQVYIKSTDTFIRLNVEGEEIRTTPSHLFFTDDGWWKAADNIKAGDKIVDSSGRLREVYSTELEKLNEPERIYNLNVEDYHTYFVGKSGLLVHN
ncbi:MAG: hypothetical protein GX660_08290, partial [Clostridiaceae bacterium]|nr:hypothetical protein [Clostridiaceae bacterium]